MKIMSFSVRNIKEIVRDKVNLCFGLGFPIVLLLLLYVIGINVPENIFPIDEIAPGIAVFALSFISLFSAQIISKDRTTAFMMRLMASPMKSRDYIIGYTLPLLPISIAQSAVCLAFALILGLELSANIFLCILVLIPAVFLYISIGLLCGSIFNDKQVGGICGALLTNVSAFLSGIWFDLKLVGGYFEKIAYLLPFVHAVDASKNAINGRYDEILPHLIWVCGYAILIYILSVFVFMRKAEKQ